MRRRDRLRVHLVDADDRVPGPRRTLLSPRGIDYYDSPRAPGADRLVPSVNVAKSMRQARFS
jgi:hypothetical protein